MTLNKRFIRIVLMILSIFLVISLGASCITIVREGGPESSEKPGDNNESNPGDSFIDTIVGKAKDLISKAENLPGQLPLGGQTAPPRGVTGTISTGAQSDLTSQNIDSSGGTIIIDKPGDALNGMKIEVPSGAYTNSRTFKISSAPVSSHTFGEYFNPLTPLITVENGGGYSERLIEVTIPVQVPEDYFVMAFFYDDARKKLEGIPFVAVNKTSITVATRHFSKFTISGIANSYIDNILSKDIESQFRPGIDDWQFVNYGSYLARGGHCAGQSLTALWYFSEQPDGANLTLNNRYDNNGQDPETPQLWQDDSYGYRFASVIQNDINWSSFENELFTNLAGVDDEVTFKAFAYGMYMTGEPQEVGIFSSAGGGHDMTVYRIYKNNMYISDPNYPGNTDRRIEYVNGAFKPYNSGANKAEIDAGHGKNYETIEYCAKTATIDWNKIAGRWKEFKAGTIGNDSFPGYDIVVVDGDGKEQPLVDGFVASEKALKIVVRGNGFSSAWRVYRDGKTLNRDDKGRYELNPGNNKLGIYVVGDVNNDPNNRNWAYVDFKYINVEFEDEECKTGWILESVTPKINRYEGNEYLTGLVFNAQEGSYSGKGTHRGNLINQQTWEATYDASGSWTPFPKCLKPDEKKTVTMNSKMDFSIIPPSVQWGNVYSSFYITDDFLGQELGRINLEAQTGSVPAPQSKTIDIVILGDGFEGAEHEFTVHFFTDSGDGEYRYKYVWK